MSFQQNLNFSTDGYDWDSNEFADLFPEQATFTLIEPSQMTLSGTNWDNTQNITLEGDEVLSFLLDLSLTSGLQLRVTNPGLGNVDVQAAIDFEFEIEAQDGSGLKYSVDTKYPYLEGSSLPTITAGMLDYDEMALDLMISPELGSKLENVSVDLGDGTKIRLNDLLLISDTAESGYFELISVDRDGNFTVSDRLSGYEVDGVLPGDDVLTRGNSIQSSSQWPNEDSDRFKDYSYKQTRTLADFNGFVTGVLDFASGDEFQYLFTDSDIDFYGLGAAVFLPQVASKIDLTQEFIFDPENVYYTASIDGVVVGQGFLGSADFDFTIPEAYIEYGFDIDWNFKLLSNMQASGSAKYNGLIEIDSVGGAVGVQVGVDGDVGISAGQTEIAAQRISSIFTIDDLYNSGIVDVSDVFSYDLTTKHTATRAFTIEGTSLADLVAQETLVPKTSSDLVNDWLQAGLGQFEGVMISDVYYIGVDEAAFQIDTFSAYGKFNDQNGLLFSTGGLPDDLNDDDGHSVMNYAIGHEAIRELMQNAIGAGYQSYDASGMEFTLDISDPDVKSIRFEFVFGSEELPEYNDTSYSDFAAIVVNGENIALFDGDPTKPMGAFTKTVQSGYYIDNSKIHEDGSGFLVPQWTIEWDGFTEYLTVTAPLVYGENTIEIVIADTQDAGYDSGLYIGDIELITQDGIANSILKISDFEYGDDIYATIADEELNLPEGSNMVIGTLQHLDGDILKGFETGDSVWVLDQVISDDNLTVSNDGTRLEIDIDQDGNADSTLNFHGDFTSASFVTSKHQDGTLITVSFETKEITGSSGSGVIAGGGGYDNIFDAIGDDEINGNGGDDKLVSLDGANTFNGGDGSDFIIGGMHGDVMFGGADNDILRGDASLFLGGADHLNGGRGDDILMGGKGADVFEFNPDAGSDIIAGFDTDAVVKSDMGHSVTDLRADFDVIFDQVLLSGFETVTAANVMDFVSQGDTGAVFSAEGSEFTFYGIDKSAILADHFEFV